MIEVYPVKIEGLIDDRLLFTIESFDDFSATISLETTLTPGELDEVFAAIRRGYDLLDLKPNPVFPCWDPHDGPH